MAKESEQLNLLDCKPEEKKQLQFWKILKSKYFWMGSVLVIGLVVAWFNNNLRVEFLTVEKTKIFFSKNWLILFGTVSLLLTFLAIWLIPKWQVKSLNNKKGGQDQSEFDLEKERIKLRDDVRKTLIQVIGGVFVVLSLIITYNTYQLNLEKEFNEQYQQAYLLLGNQDVSTKQGGLYKLEIIANNSSNLHRTVMETLAGHIRKNSTKSTERPKFENDCTSIPNNESLPIDVQTAIEIIERRNKENDLKFFGLDLSNANLNSVGLRYSVLRNTSFIGTDLNFAIFSYADLSGTYFNNAYLYNAKFLESDLNGAVFINADLRCAQLKNADLRNANLNTNYLTYEKLKEAAINETTQLPSHLETYRAELLQLSNEILEYRKSRQGDIKKKQEETQIFK